MSSKLRSEADQLYKDLQADAKDKPDSMVSAITAQIFNRILEDAQKEYPENTTLTSMPQAEEGTNVADLLKMTGQLKENIYLDTWSPPKLY